MAAHRARRRPRAGARRAGRMGGAPRARASSARPRARCWRARRHVGPLRVQKALYPEGAGVCQAIVVHPPGGIVGGDSLAIEVDAGAARARAAHDARRGEVVPVRGTGRALRRPRCASRRGALVEWLPQETMLFDGARAAIRLRVELARGRALHRLGRDAASGAPRRASASRPGACARRSSSSATARLLWCERAVLDGGSRALQSGAILDGAPVFGTMIVAGARRRRRRARGVPRRSPRVRRRAP